MDEKTRLKPQRTFTLRHVLAAQVRKIRAEQNQSLATLASGTGLSLERLKSIESGLHNATLDDLTRLSIGLAIQPGKLIQPSEHISDTDRLEPVVLVQACFVALLERCIPNDIDSIVNYLDRCGVTFIDNA